MSFEKYVFLKLIISIIFHNSDGANILALTPVMSHSHHLWNRVLLIELAKRGHNVTYIGPDGETKNTPNFTPIVFEGIYESFEGSFDIEDVFNQGTINRALLLFDYMPVTCEMELQHEAVKTLENYPSDAFDLILTDICGTECFYPFITKFGSPPVVGISPFGLVPWGSAFMGGYEYPEFVPHYGLKATNYMSFTDRMMNFFLSSLTLIYRKYVTIPKIDAMAKKRFGNTFTSVADIEKQIGIFLVNIDPVVDWPRPLLPNVIPVSGLHIPEPRPLSEKFQQFLDNANEGVVIFSLGSNVKVDSLPLGKQKALLEAFSQLPQKIICRWEVDPQLQQPKNILFSKWLPQSDLLAHPKVKLLFTHGGALSTQEAIYRGVPIVGMPFFLDQETNMYKIVQREYGLEINYVTLSVETILHALKEVLQNPKYKNNIKRASAQFQDYPQSSLERAVFWTEYALRHKNISHLQTPTIHMSFYQTHSLDLIAAFIFILITPVFCLYLIFKKICRNKVKTD